MTWKIIKIIEFSTKFTTFFIKFWKLKLHYPLFVCLRSFYVSNTYLNVGILLSKVSNTVTSPFNGAWFDSSSCLIADILILKSLKISVLPRTPVRSVIVKGSLISFKTKIAEILSWRNLILHLNIWNLVLKILEHPLPLKKSCLYLAKAAPDFDTTPAQFPSVSVQQLFSQSQRFRQQVSSQASLRYRTLLGAASPHRKAQSSVTDPLTVTCEWWRVQKSRFLKEESEGKEKKRNCG
jgi:hypothetical protein